MGQIKTIEQSINAKTPIIGEMRKAYGDDVTLNFLALWIADLQFFLNVNRGMEDVHIDQTCEIIMDDYRNISMSDLNIIFTKAKKGGYGQFFENLAMPKILSWFEEYQNERSNLFGEITRRNAQSNSSDFDRPIIKDLGTRLESKFNSKYPNSKI